MFAQAAIAHDVEMIIKRRAVQSKTFLPGLAVAVRARRAAGRLPQAWICPSTTESAIESIVTRRFQ
jgi:hypothetical protein